MLYVIGIDCNTKQLAVVTLNPDGSYRSGDLLPPKVKPGAGSRERLYTLSDAIKVYLDELPLDVNVVVAYVEEVPMVQNPRTLIELAYVVGQVLVESYRAGYSMMPVNVSTWKANTVGNGKAEKPEIKEWAIKNIPGMPEDLKQDIYDAACIARFAWKNNSSPPEPEDTETRSAAKSALGAHLKGKR